MTTIQETLADRRLDSVIRDDTISLLVDIIAWLKSELEDAHARIDEIWAMGEAEARIAGRPYPAGPFGLACFADEGEARFAWSLIQHLLNGDDRSKWEPFPSLVSLANSKQRRKPQQPNPQPQAISKPNKPRKRPAWEVSQ